MMWKFEVNPKRNEEVWSKNINLSKKFKGGIILKIVLLEY
jgi:hypothetical protein